MKSNFGLPVCALALATIPFIPARAASSPPGEVYAHWTFDHADGDFATVRDLGPHGFHGTLHTDNDHPLRRGDGIRGEALHFPRNHQSWVAIEQGFGLEPPFTITAWAKIEGRRATMEILGQKAHSWDQGMRYIFSLQRMFFEYSDGKENLAVRNDLHQTRPNQWVFLAVVHDGQEIALYVDAEEIQREPARPLKPTRRHAFIGNYVVRKDTYGFEGLLDEMIILSEALSPKRLVELGLWALCR